MARRRIADDLLEEVVSEEAARTPSFPAMVDGALERRRVAAGLARARAQRRLSQVQVAARMRTAQSVVSRLEAGEDVKVSTLLRYAEVVGVRLAWSRARRARA